MTAVSRQGESPFAQWELQTITFNYRDQDTEILHNLTTEGPEQILYFPLSKSADCTVYHTSQSGWTNRRVLLRCNVAPATVTLLLVVLV